MMIRLFADNFLILPRRRHGKTSLMFNNLSMFSTSDSGNQHRGMNETKDIMDKTLSFALSGCGWLSPFYIGAMEQLRKDGYLTDRSICAGTSGGSLGALIAVAGIDSKAALSMVVSQAQSKSFTSNIDKGLKESLRALLPHDAVEKCNGRLVVVVTRVWPDPEPLLISNFDSMDHLLDVVCASCFIPLYSTPKQLFAQINNDPGKIFMDGGFPPGHWMPPIGDVRLSPFPSNFIMKRPPHIYIDPGSPIASLPKLLSWVLIPPPPSGIKALYEEGVKAAAKWTNKRRMNV